MSIMLNNYIDTDRLAPVVPAWFRAERYDYCERINKRGTSSKRNIFSFITDRKNIKK